MSLHKWHIDGESTQKYGAKRTEIDGHSFDSRAEANRYAELKLLLASGEIKHLELQVAYPLVVNGMKVATYKADFRYVDLRDNLLVVEDVKSPATKTAVYRLKRKLMLALYNIEILETGGE